MTAAPDIRRPGAGGRGAQPRPPAAGALLSPEPAGWRPLRGFGAADRDRVAHAAASVLRRWREAWSLDGGEPVDGEADGISCEPTADAGAPAPRHAGAWSPAGSAPGLWWSDAAADAEPGSSPTAPGAASLSALSGALFRDALPRDAPATERSAESGFWPRKRPTATVTSQAEAGRTIAAEVVLEAWDDLRDRLAALGAGGTEAIERERSAPPAAAWRPWSGALVLTVPWWGGRLLLLLAGERVERILGGGAPRAPVHPGAAAPPLTPLWRALGRRTARLRAEMLPFELDLGTVAGLRVGDVLRTAQTLDTPLTVTVDGPDGASATTLCAGFLGKSGGTRAVELLPSPPVRAPPAPPGAPPPTSTVA